MIPINQTSDPFEQTQVLFCPGCELWQLDYTLTAVEDLVRFRPQYGVDLTLVDQLIERILADHVQNDCRAPRKVMELWKKSQQR